MVIQTLLLGGQNVVKPGVDGAEEVVEAELQNTEPERVQQEHRGQEARPQRWQGLRRSGGCRRFLAAVWSLT